jgi:hypothetical protein
VSAVARYALNRITAGMTTARWIAEVPPRAVQLSDVQPIQPPCECPGCGGSTDPIPHVVEIGGLFYLEDGHHRYYRAVRDGRSWMLVRVLSSYAGL